MSTQHQHFHGFWLAVVTFSALWLVFWKSAITSAKVCDYKLKRVGKQTQIGAKIYCCEPIKLRELLVLSKEISVLWCYITLYLQLHLTLWTQHLQLWSSLFINYALVYCHWVPKMYRGLINDKLTLTNLGGVYMLPDRVLIRNRNLIPVHMKKFPK